MATTVGNTSQPTWEIAHLFPDQGHWDEQEYLALTHSTNRLVEFSAGRVEVLPMPKTSHQMIVAFLYQVLLTFTAPRKLGRVLFAPLRVRLPHGAYREPDVVFMLAEHAGRIGEDYWEGAGLVVEVVSEENREHDLVTKRREYAEAGIPEYWIVDPAEQTITVLHLAGNEYQADGPFKAGQQSPSRLLAGFSVDVRGVFDAARGDQ